MASKTAPHLATSVKLSDGTTYGYMRNAPASGKPWLLFLHGYPSSSYDWRHQVKSFSELGYGLIIPDLLGYGDTDKPKDLESYTMPRMGKQVAELLDKEGIDKVVGIGHDWGCGLLSSMARHHSKYFTAVVFMSVGYLAESFGDIDAINEEMTKQLGYSIFGYWKFHEQDDCAEVIEAHQTSFHSICFPPDPEIWKTHLCPIGALREFIVKDEPLERPSWISQEEMETHKQVMQAGGLTGPLNWYKQEMKGLSLKEDGDLSKEERTLKMPVLFVGTLNDVVCVASLNEHGTREWTKDLTVANIETGHWLMLEKPEETDKILIDFIEKKAGKSLLGKIVDAIKPSVGTSARMGPLNVALLPK